MKIVNEILVVYPDFKPGIIENTRLLFLTGQWDFAKEKAE